MSTEQKAKDYAKNYPLVLADSNFMGPISVGNINEHNGRVIVNLCLVTAKSNPKNASISFPKEWSKATQFKPGDQVNVKIEQGYVKNIWLAKPESVKDAKRVSASKVNEEVGEAMENQAAEEVVDQTMNEVNQNTLVAAEEEDDKPF